MKAVAFQGKNHVQVIDVREPSPGPGEVVLKVHNCGICGSDLHAVQHGFGMPPGAVMGHEFSGEIHRLGPGVNGFEIGQRVTSLPYVSCGECEECRHGDGMHCERIRGIGLGQIPGAYAEYVLCGAASVLRLPDNVSSREGALVEPLAVGLHGVNRARLRPGAGCVVMGAGPIGLATLLWCKARGASAVVVSELAQGRSEVALRLGATEVVNPTKDDPVQRLVSLVGQPPAAIFECIGAKSTLGAAIAMAPKHGRVVVAGVCMEPDEISPLACVLKEISIDFVLGYTRDEFKGTIDALASGLIEAGPMITDVVGIDAVPAMFQALKSPGARAKVMLEFPH